MILIGTVNLTSEKSYPMEAAQSISATAVTTRVTLANAADVAAIALLTRLAMDSTHHEGLLNAEITPSVERSTGEWTITHRFHSEAHAENWRASTGRLELIEQLGSYLVQSGHRDETSQEQCAATVAACITSLVKPGMETDYRNWLSEIQTAQAQFPGYQGTYVQTPTAENGGHWTTVLRFDNPENLDRWFRSEQRLALLAKSRGLVASQNIHHMHSAFPGWLPTDPEGRSPENWKAAMLVLLGLYPVVELQMHYLNPLIASWPQSVGVFFSIVMSVSLISFVEMPVLTKVFADWLLPKPNVDKRRSDLIGFGIILFLYFVENILFWFFK